MQILSVSTQSTMTMEQSTKEENSFARLSANVDLLCTSETKVTVSQKLSWLTHRNPQRGERQTDNKEYRVGGGSSVRVIYSDAGQIGCNMLIRRKAFWFPIPKNKNKNYLLRQSNATNLGNTEEASLLSPWGPSHFRPLYSVSGSHRNGQNTVQGSLRKGCKT